MLSIASPGRAVCPLASRRVGDPRFGHFALDRYVDLAPLARQPLQQELTDFDQARERGLGGPRDVGGDAGELGRGGKRQSNFFSELGRGERAIQQRRGMLRSDIRRARDADATAVQHPHIHARLFGHPGRLEAAPLERHGCAFDAPLERVRTVPLVRAAPGQLEQPVDHAGGRSPPMRASSMRTCGAPSVTGSGNCPPLPQPPPI